MQKVYLTGWVLIHNLCVTVTSLTPLDHHEKTQYKLHSTRTRPDGKHTRKKWYYADLRPAIRAVFRSYRVQRRSTERKKKSARVLILHADRVKRLRTADNKSGQQPPRRRDRRRPCRGGSDLRSARTAGADVVAPGAACPTLRHGTRSRGRRTKRRQSRCGGQRDHDVGGGRGPEPQRSRPGWKRPSRLRRTEGEWGGRRPATAATLGPARAPRAPAAGGRSTARSAPLAVAWMARGDENFTGPSAPPPTMIVSNPVAQITRRILALGKVKNHHYRGEWGGRVGDWKNIRPAGSQPDAFAVYEDTHAKPPTDTVSPSSHDVKLSAFCPYVFTVFDFCPLFFVFIRFLLNVSHDIFYLNKNPVSII